MLKTILLLSVLALLLASCGGGTEGASPTDTRTPTASTSGPTSTATSTSSPSQTAAPIAYGLATLVEGWATCRADFGTTTTDPDGTMHGRNGKFTCTTTSNDPRVAGSQVDQWRYDHWGDVTGGGLVQWGTSRLQNDGGTWVGTFTGIYTDDTGDIITYWYTGTGGYAGLSYYVYLRGSGPLTWPTQGLIFPGNPPTP